MSLSHSPDPKKSFRGARAFEIGFVFGASLPVSGVTMAVQLAYSVHMTISFSQSAKSSALASVATQSDLASAL
jgi:hypothetical protein